MKQGQFERFYQEVWKEYESLLNRLEQGRRTSPLIDRKTRAFVSKDVSLSFPCAIQTLQ